MSCTISESELLGNMEVLEAFEGILCGQEVMVSYKLPESSYQIVTANCYGNIYRLSVYIYVPIVRTCHMSSSSI